MFLMKRYRDTEINDTNKSSLGFNEVCSTNDGLGEQNSI